MSLWRTFARAVGMVRGSSLRIASIGEISRSSCSLGTAILVGLPILRSVRGKCQTAEVDFTERERADQPAVIRGTHPGKLKQKLRCSFGKGSAARHRAQNEGRIRLRPRAQQQGAARPADIHGMAEFDEKPAGRGQTARRKGECGCGPRLMASGPERLRTG